MLSEGASPIAHETLPQAQAFNVNVEKSIDILGTTNSNSVHNSNVPPVLPESISRTNSSSAPNNRKRKHASVADAAVDHSAIGTPDPDALTPNENLFKTASVHASANRPRLTVSRLPIFVPIAEGSPYCIPDQIATNRLGFRYTPAGLADPGCKVPYRTIESGPPGYVRVSWEDRSPLIRVTSDGLGLMGDKGFRTARCNVPIREGKWYMEVKIEQGGGDKAQEGKMREGAYVRLGWSRREAPLNGPVGLDGYSYAYRDKSGEKVTLSRPKPYGKPFGTGDVVGMYISLPPKRRPKANDSNDPAQIKRERIAIEFKGQEYFEAVEYPQSKEMIALMDDQSKAKASASLPSNTKKSATVKNIPDRNRNTKPAPEQAPLRPIPTLADSRVSFFVNGECQGVAFQDLYDYLQLRVTPTSRKNQGRKRHKDGAREHKENPFDDGHLGYYPSISLFNGARIKLNPGPDFEFPPPNDIDQVLNGNVASAENKERTWRPMCERYSEFMAEQWELDAKEELEAQREVAPTPAPAAPPATSAEIEAAEAKAAARREKKRISEQKRRARKAEENKINKQKAKEAKALAAEALLETASQTQTNERYSSIAPSLLDELLDDTIIPHRHGRSASTSSVEPEMLEAVTGWNSDDNVREGAWTPSYGHYAADQSRDEDDFFIESILDD